MTHPLSGVVPVEESARLIRNYRYAVERMMRILGGWIALTPELSAKLLMGRHVWDNAQHADALGRRLPELRAAAHVSEPANPAFVAFMDVLEQPERPHQTVERVVGVYRVLKPHLLATYEAHLGEANQVYEPPTARILARCAGDERRHIAAGGVVLGHLIAGPALEQRATEWQSRLEKLLAESGGVTGLGLAPIRASEAIVTAESLSDDGRQFIALEQAGNQWSVPDDLAGAVRRLGEALIAGDAIAVRRSVAGDIPLDDLAAALASRRFTVQRIVAVTKIGSQRVIKLRLDGPAGGVVVSTRWGQTGEGWRAHTLDLVTEVPALR